MRRYPKARGLFAAWLHAQQQRDDLVGQLAKAAADPANNSPRIAFRIVTWRKWAVEHGLTDAHVEAMFSEYCRVPLAEKYQAYDQFPAARSVSSVSSNSGISTAKE